MASGTVFGLVSCLGRRPARPAVPARSCLGPNWATTDPALLERLTRLIGEATRSPFEGIGKPEPLKHQLKGYWSRRINAEHRLVYKATPEAIIIVSFRYHY